MRAKEGLLFLKKKKQKNFISGAITNVRHGPGSECRRTGKSFLVLFFKKGLLPSFLLTSALAGCDFPGPVSPEQQAVVQGCRAAADRAYNAQNRYQLSERDNRDTPFSGNGQAASPSDGLADQYTHANRVEDCVRHDGLATP